ncbi:hypothetical protein EYR40_005844 [Pleurotus pulmonarius]|nr:hypothetical protein EYR36_005766 [Pleurotus pulmonarius]KAF4602629.1 hypothetical protein EYR40_005844 [Pleurotus pulmonarius]
MSQQDKLVVLAYNPQKETYDFIEEPEASSSQTTQAVPAPAPAPNASATEIPSALPASFSVELSPRGPAGTSRPKVTCPRVRHLMIQGLAVMAVGNCVTIPTRTREGGWSIQTIGYLRSDAGVMFSVQLAAMLARFSAFQKQKAEQAQQAMRPGGIRSVQSVAQQTQTLPPIRDMLPEGFLDSLPRTAPPRVAAQPSTPSDSRRPTDGTQQAGAPQAASPLRMTAKHNARGPASNSRSSATQIVKRLPQTLSPPAPQKTIYSMADREAPMTGAKQRNSRKQKSSLQTRPKDSIA